MRKGRKPYSPRPLHFLMLFIFGECRKWRGFNGSVQAGRRSNLSCKIAYDLFNAFAQLKADVVF